MYGRRLPHLFWLVEAVIVLGVAVVVVHRPAPPFLVIFGDSLAANEPWAVDLEPDSLTLGVGGETCSDMMRRVGRIPVGAREVLVIVGANDRRVGHSPVATSRCVAHLLVVIQEHCLAARVLRIEPPAEAERLPDGVHLTRRGYGAWLQGLRRVVWRRGA